MSKVKNWLEEAKKAAALRPTEMKIRQYTATCDEYRPGMSLTWRDPRDVIYTSGGQQLPCLSHTFNFTSEEALALARWIDEAFGEPSA